MNLLIFDLDGTLVDCKDLHRESFRQAISYQCPDIKFDDDEIEGLPTPVKINYLRNKGYKLTNDLDIIKRDYTNNNIHKYIKFNQELLDHFNRLYKKYKLCLASNSRSEFVFKCMNILKLWHFSAVYTRDYGPAKPDPWMYNECIRVVNTTPNNTVIFEDSPVGIEGAKKTTTNVIEINDSNHLIEKLYEF